MRTCIRKCKRCLEVIAAADVRAHLHRPPGGAASGVADSQCDIMAQEKARKYEEVERKHEERTKTRKHTAANGKPAPNNMRHSDESEDDNCGSDSDHPSRMPCSQDNAIPCSQHDLDTPCVVRVALVYH